ncbi:MAG: hypothetical protein NUW01_13675, partial [Gemmatimonadaceae bacterium]|nr:hypothetical protein [Gemmatimonadaceae bacterium]
MTLTDASRGWTTESESWPTPTAALTNDDETPETFRARKLLHASKEEGATRAGVPLTIAVKEATWSTPVASPNANRGTSCPPSQQDGSHGVTLASQVADTRLDLPTETAGPSGSPNPGTPGLNPRFVESLMGWPLGWTDCGRAATESYRTWQRSWPTPMAADAIKGSGTYMRGNLALKGALRIWNGDNEMTTPDT